MRIAGFEKCSLVDYPGKMAAVVFTPGCNMDCFYCHNRWIVSAGADFCAYDPERVLAFLDTRNGLLDGVVITGGEPTLQPGLEEFAARVRDMGYPVKLDTNGTNPARLGRLIERGLVDYVAMDLKAPLDRSESHCDYESLCGPGIDLEAVDASVRLLLEGWVEYEFRTTVAPQLGRADLFAMARRIRGARRWVLQQYRVPEYVASSELRVASESRTGVSPVEPTSYESRVASSNGTGFQPVFASEPAQVSAAVEAFDSAAVQAFDLAAQHDRPRERDDAHATFTDDLWSARTRPRFESGDMSPHSKTETIDDDSIDSARQGDLDGLSGLARDIALDPRFDLPPHSPYLILEWAASLAPLVRCLQTRGLGIGDTAIVSATAPSDLPDAYDAREEGLIRQAAV